MKRAEFIALCALIGLLVVGAILTATGVVYGSIIFWAGCMAAFCQALVAGLAWFGLRTARQQQMQEPQEPDAPVIPEAPFGAFRMSYSDETNANGGAVPATPAPRNAANLDRDARSETVRTLDVGFQRVCVVLASVAFLALSVVLLLWVRSQMGSIPPGGMIVISQRAINPGAVVAAFAALVIYFALWSMSRPTDETRLYGDAIRGLTIMGLPVGLVLFGTVLLAWAGVHYAVQVGAIVIALMMLLQGIELLINSLKSYAAIEELDLHAVDLNELPLAPMLSSVWISGLQLLLSQSVGIRRQTDVAPGVMSRLLPKVLLAIFFSLLLISMLRVVPAGEVAIREHLGAASQAEIDHPLQPGLHVMWPWPIDQLVVIPTQKVQQLTVGTEEAKKTGAPVGPNGFVVWADHTSKPGNDFLTGDVTESTGLQSPKMLGGFISVWWRVKNASDFYDHISHSAFVESGGATGLSAKKRAVPVYDSMVQQVALSSATRALGLYSLAYSIGPGRAIVERQCRTFMQKEFDRLHSGIDIVEVAFTDLHPPSFPTQQGANGPIYGPARAYEEVIVAREDKQTAIDIAQKQAFRAVQEATGTGRADVDAAKAYTVGRVNVETGKSAALIDRSDAFAKDENTAKVWELYQTLNKVFQGVNKVVLGPNVVPPTLWQLNRNGTLSSMSAAPLPPR